MKYPFLLFTFLFVFSTFSHGEKWDHEISGSFPIFFTYINEDNGEQAMRVMSGFNPANVTISSMSPKDSDYQVKATLQITHHLQGAKVQNSGLFESRVADVQITTGSGQINIGKGFGIFNSNAIGDVGSGKGIGALGGADVANATGGHIGTGYVYANFNPRIMYSAGSGNISYKLGVFDPEEPGGASPTTETPLPRFEGQATMDIGGGSKVWAGFMYQQVESTVEDFNIQAMDVGGHFQSGPMGVRAAYTITTGIGADGLYGFGGLSDAEIDGSQFYVEGTYNMGRMTYGASYGIGDQDSGTNASGAIAEIENTLLMLFAHKKLNDNLHVMFEVQTYTSESGSTTLTEYTAASTGIQVDF